MRNIPDRTQFESHIGDQLVQGGSDLHLVGFSVHGNSIGFVLEIGLKEAGVVRLVFM